MQGDLLAEAVKAFDSEGESAGSDIVNIGHDIAYPPWTSIQEGMASGVSIDHAIGLLGGAGVKINFVGGQWAELYQQLRDGELDCILNVGWPTEIFKDEPVTASKPYEQFKIKIFSKAEGLVSLDSLKGRKIAVQKGSFAKDIVTDLGCEPVTFDNDIQGMVQVLWNNVAGVATEERVGRFISDQLFLGAINSVTDVLSSLDVVYLMRNNDEKTKDLFSLI
jgi:ABC-type amino acid transport substrate-binding protein